VCLLLALGLLGAAKGRYTVQPVSERGPLSRTVAYAVCGIGFALAAALFLGLDG
jgi:hypothetical protein